MSPLHNLYIANLPPDTAIEEVTELLNPYGEIQEAKLIFNQVTGEPRHAARVRIDVDPANNNIYHQLTGLELNGNFLYVSRAKPPQKGKAERPTDEAKRDAAKVAAMLYETEYQPRTQLLRIVMYLGMPFVEYAIEEARRVEEAGGLMVMDFSRRRTFGGVFFQLVRRKITSQMHRYIFYIAPPRAPYKKPIKKKPQAKDAKPKQGKPDGQKKDLTPKGQGAQDGAQTGKSKGLTPEGAQRQHSELLAALSEAQGRLNGLKSLPPDQRKAGLFSATRDVVNLQKQIALLRKQYPELS